RVWQRLTFQTNRLGRTIVTTNSYTEIASGMHHFANGQWVESSDQIEIKQAGGAAAQNGPHHAYFPGDLYTDAIAVTTPDNRTLVFRPLGLCFADSQRSVLIAELKSGSIGHLLPSGNQVLW